MQKLISIDGIDTPIILARRKGTRQLRLSVKSDGKIRVTVPFGIPEKLALQFVLQKKDWIAAHHRPAHIFKDGDRVGKSHTLHFVRDSSARSVRTRLKSPIAQVTIPTSLPDNDEKVQKAARSVAEKALDKEASILLPQRLSDIAQKHHKSAATLKVKKLRSRWGSCDSRGNITLNIYLMQLPWSLIDYVIVHELAHLKHQHHQAAFWDEVASMLPEWKSLRKELKAKRTDVLATNL